jgi:hypothetical protein
MMEISARGSMNRVHGLFTVAKCFAAKGVEKNDEPVWIAGTFSMLLDLIVEEIDIAVAQIGKSAGDGPAT